VRTTAAACIVAVTMLKLTQQKEKEKVEPRVEPRTYIKKVATYSHSVAGERSKIISDYLAVLLAKS
jgi:hypothetical protein